MMAADAALLDRVADELIGLQDTDGNLTVELPPLAAMQLAGVLTWTMRSSAFDPATRALSAALLQLARQYFADCPAVLAVLSGCDTVAADAGTQTRH
jgi:hypothetical protein